MTGKQATDWAKAIAILGGLMLGGYSTFVKGEPGAELAYKELAKSFNELRTEFLQQKSYNEGFMAGFMQPTAPQESQPVSPPPVKPDAAVVKPDAAPPPPKPAPRPTEGRPPPSMRRKPGMPRALPPMLEQLKKGGL